MASVESIQRRIQSILAFEVSVPKPPTSVCTSIQTLKDLIDLDGFQSGWRRTAPAEAGIMFRNSAGGQSPRNACAPSDTAPENKRLGGFRNNPETPMSRVSSSKSFPDSSTSGSISPSSPIPKYQSKFKNSEQPMDEKILHVIILSKLNKFSPKTYNDIRDFLYQILGSGEPDLQQMVRDFMKLVFKKAALEEIFCPLYAKLLCEISTRYSVILQEMNSLQSNYLNVFDNIEESTSSDYDEFVESQKNKQFRLGYSQFLAELSALEILDLQLLNITFKKILSNMLRNGVLDDKKTLMEEYCDCLSRMAKVLKKKTGRFFITARATLFKDNEEALNKLIDNQAEFPSETNKTRFILMDVRDILVE
jgi:hypothetical protein